ncbi:MAG TPA: DUF3866 family protein [Acidimicrobiales bacterium]|nr:DUF3866 family protein [Acidimicrobiales bacterium]
MPSFRTGTVTEILAQRAGLQRVLVGSERAYVLTQLTGDVAPGDEVVMNTTAVDLGLGTGGWHVVHWNLSRREWSEPGPGHILKLRYTSLQVDTGAREEEAPPPDDLDGTPVVACFLHSQLPAVAAAFKSLAPGARLAYVMTDGAALPLALSDLVAELRDRSLLDLTVTAGHAFGGDAEAVNLHSALLVARGAGADAIVAGIGPGVVGTGTAYGHTGLGVVDIVEATFSLRGAPIVALRVSDADPRERHRGVSHHAQEALDLLSAPPAIPAPDDATPDAVALFAEHDLTVTTMGRRAEEERAFFQYAAAAGAAAAHALARD